MGRFERRDEIVREILRGDLVVPRAASVPEVYEHLPPRSIILVRPEEQRKDAQKRLSQAQTQFERAMWQSVIDGIKKPEEQLKDAEKRLSQAQSQEERVRWKSEIDEIKEAQRQSQIGLRTYCRFCERFYKIRRASTAIIDCCYKSECRRQRDAERQRKRYWSSVAVRKKKIADVQDARARKAAAQKTLAAKSRMI
jgi:hypothetical protein